MTTLRPELSDIPLRMKYLPLDHRGYPVPWFVGWFNEEKTEELPVGEGIPDFRILRSTAVAEAIKNSQCWVCGGRLGKYRSTVIGPMCIVNRISAEPPSHRECGEWAARRCPFLARPHMKRNERGIEREGDGESPTYSNMPGVGILRNPGVGAVWTSDKPPRPFRVPNGLLFRLSEPTSVAFYVEGRDATREEVEASIESGLPELLRICDGEKEEAEVYRLAELAAKYLPPVAA